MTAYDSLIIKKNFKFRKVFNYNKRMFEPNVELNIKTFDLQVAQPGGLSVTAKPSPEGDANFEVLCKNKHGIVITEDLSCTLEIQEDKDLVVTIENLGELDQILFRGVFMSKKSQSQLSLITPRIDASNRLQPNSKLSYVFNCRAKFVGTSEELFIFIFKGFKIGRMFRITVNARNATAYSTPLTRGKRQKLATQGDYDQESYIQGVRPCKAPSFIAVRTGIFRVPQRFWDAVLPCVNNGATQIDCVMAVTDEISCLSQALTFVNYTMRFHALLYLEEISLTIDLQRYEMESAILRPSGEYLSLTVPGLAEKRPSLMIGDRAIVSFSWDDSRGLRIFLGFMFNIHNAQRSESRKSWPKLR